MLETKRMQHGLVWWIRNYIRVNGRTCIFSVPFLKSFLVFAGTFAFSLECIHSRLSVTLLGELSCMCDAVVS